MADAARPEEDAQPALDAQRLEALNLEQALVDVELANARVVDLTGRVTSLSEDVLRLRAEVGNLQLLLAQERAEGDRLRAAAAQAQAEIDELRAPRPPALRRYAGRARRWLVRR